MWWLAVVIACLTQAAWARLEKPADFVELKRLTDEHFAQTRFLTWGIASRSGSPTNTWECNNVTPVPSGVSSQLDLSSFYRKYLHAFGIPIISSSQPSDAALRRACYVVVFLLADRPDIRQWLYKRNGRAGVVGYREGVTSIPEHSWLPSWWNQRARGLGGTISNPISTCGEENIMCASGDRYPREDIFLHEFTHGIHEIAIVKGGAIPDFDSRLNPRYRYLKSTGALWSRTYAMSTDREYFAEGTQSYFDVNDEAIPTNGIHNHVNTRIELQSYDSELYKFNKEVFPCANRIVERCEAKGNVPKERWYFKMNCDKNGNGILMDFKTKKPVGGGPTSSPPQPPSPPPPNTLPPPTNTQAPPTPPPNTQAPPTPPPNTQAPPTPPPNTQAPPTPPPNTQAPPTPPPNTQAPPTSPPNTQAPPTPPPSTQPPVTNPPVNCVDNNRNCYYWASRGECTRNPGYMNVNCKKSCNKCNVGGNCKDKHARCSEWAGRGECARNPAYMLLYCKKSCSRC